MCRVKHTMADLVVIQNYILGKITIPERAIPYYDLNGDGKVNSMDYVILAKELGVDDDAAHK